MAKSLSDIKVVPGSKFEHFRKGQGLGSGNGKTAGKGQKGQGAHAHTKKNGFEGGQMPLNRRLPKFGFTNFTRVEFVPINLDRLNVFEEGEEVTLTKMVEKGLVKKNAKVKVLGNGTLEKTLTVKAHAFSASAKSAIEAKGGKAEVVK